MGRTLEDLANIVYIEVSEKEPVDSTILARIKTFVNRAYKEVAKREKLEKSVEVTVTNYKFAKPSDYYKVSKIEYNGEPIDCEEEEGYIVVDADYEGETVKHYYYYIPADLTDGLEPLTNKSNDEAIISETKRIYFISDNKYDKAEAAKRDFETYQIKKQKKSVQMKVYR